MVRKVRILWLIRRQPWKLFVYYESIKRELKTRPVYEYRCDERLKTKTVGSTRLVYTGFLGGTGTPKDGNLLYYDSIKRE